MRGLVRFLYGAGAAHVSKTGSGQRDPVRFIVLRLYESRLNPATDRVSMFACAMPRPRRVQLGGGSYLEARSSCCSPASPALLLCETLIVAVPAHLSVTPSAPPIWIGGRIIRSR